MALSRFLQSSFPDVPMPKWRNLMVDVVLATETILGSQYALPPMPHHAPVNRQGPGLPCSVLSHPAPIWDE